MPASYDLFCDPAFGQTVNTCCCTTFNAGTVSGFYSAVLGGPKPVAAGTNTSVASFSTVTMGQNNNIPATFNAGGPVGCYNSIINGVSNTASGYYAGVLGGKNNTADKPSATGACAHYPTVINGHGNAALGDFQLVGNGSANTVQGSLSMIGNGFNNQIFCDQSFIGAGLDNAVCESFSSIVAGIANTIECNLIGDFMGGGGGSKIDTGADNNAVFGGAVCIDCCTFNAFVGAGTEIIIAKFADNAIGSGHNVHICLSSHSSAGSGDMNRVCSNCSVAITGELSCIEPSTDYSFLGTGLSNEIHGSISGSATQTYSVLNGGRANVVCTEFSAVLGGCNNSLTGTCDLSAVFGNGLSAVAADTFHVSCLNVVNTPTLTSLTCSGAMYLATGVPIAGYGLCKFLFIK
jgi:hypothetical protein